MPVPPQNRSPEDFLPEARRESRGKLKIFLGAAPGVGKTYAMLRAGQARRAEGRDVVAALIETHGRKETEALTTELEILPRQTLTYRGKIFNEMDLDAVLRRRPQLALVDELAHTNIDGARHAKRYQDIEELLAAGIDVYTTLNVQHLESLNDIVQRITWIKIRETLPDHVLKMANEIELIDLPPEDLIQRLHDGKVYMPDQAKMAIDHYFSRGNLTALRELALRRAAEHVDSDMLGYMRTHNVSGPWPARERLIVCVDCNGTAINLIRLASRLMVKDKTAWIALYVENATQNLDERQKTEIDDALRLAESLGGEAITIHGGVDIANDIIAFARSRNATRLLVGRSHKSAAIKFLSPAIGEKLIDRATDFDITLLHAPASNTLPNHRWQKIRTSFRTSRWHELLVVTIVIVLATFVGWQVKRFLPPENLPLVYLGAVLFAAARYGLWPSLWAVLLSLAAYNFFFTEPIFTFTVYNPHDIATLLFFPIIAIVTGNITVRLKNQVEALRASSRRNAQMHDFTRKLASALTISDITQETAQSVANDLSVRAVVMMPDGENFEKLNITASFPGAVPNFSPVDTAAADWAFRNGKEAGAHSDTLPAANWYFLPLKGGGSTVAVLGLTHNEQKNQKFNLSAARRRMLYSFCDQAALAIERAHFAEAVEENRLLSQTEKLRSALLSSISHDLRTPLVSIIGSADSLQELRGNLSLENQDALIGTIVNEAERLNRFIQNLLDMTRLGHGSIVLRQEWVEFRDIVGRALTRVEKELKGHPIIIDSMDDPLALYVDPVLMEQVFVNILDNAAKYTKHGDTINIAMTLQGERAQIRFTDHGPGIPVSERERVFDMFYRVRAGDKKVAGTGLGLAICRGLIEAHGGKITAQSGIGDKGTVIFIDLPAKLAAATLPGGESEWG